MFFSQFYKDINFSRLIRNLQLYNFLDFIRPISFVYNFPSWDGQTGFHILILKIEKKEEEKTIYEINFTLTDIRDFSHTPFLFRNVLSERKIMLQMRIKWILPSGTCMRLEDLDYEISLTYEMSIGNAWRRMKSLFR